MPNHGSPLRTQERQPAVARLRRAVARAADKDHTLRSGEHVLIACSGGPDSTALVDVLARLAAPRQWVLTVAHVDHGLRPESAKEAHHVGEFVAQYDLPFYPLQVKVASKGSLQDQARQARYTALQELCKQIDADVIATGHTADDQAETVLMQMLRSATPHSLAGMVPRGDHIARPLLEMWRKDIVAYCQALDLPFINDPSNLDQRFLRVAVRHEVLPNLERQFPAAKRRLVTLAKRQQNAEEN
jgi:tRNA(Ile)-lysidine synthase